MTAATQNSRVESVQGNKRVIFANLTVDNTYTYVTGLHKLNFVSFMPTTAAACGITHSGGTVTFVTGGALTGELRAEGA